MAQARIYLVSVGISDYPGTKNDLHLCKNDAATMDWLYRENKNAESVLLTNSKATVQNVESAMNRMFAKASTTDIVVFFFSGHGVPGGFVAYDSFIPYSDIKAIMSKCKCRNKMIFADACFSGSIRQSGSQKSGEFGKLGDNIMLFLSCRTTEMSIERKGMTNGFFTYALQHALRGNADVNKDRTITAKELFDFVSSTVKKESEDRQHPVMWGKFNSNMPVMVW